jgi:hypothetical protein
VISSDKVSHRTKARKLLGKSWKEVVPGNATGNLPVGAFKHLRAFMGR